MLGIPMQGFVALPNPPRNVGSPTILLFLFLDEDLLWVYHTARWYSLIIRVWFVATEIVWTKPDSQPRNWEGPSPCLGTPSHCRSKVRNIGCCGWRARSRIHAVRCRQRTHGFIPVHLGPIGPMGLRKEAHGIFSRPSWGGQNTGGLA